MSYNIAQSDQAFTAYLTSIHDIPFLTEQEELSLIKAYKAGDEAAGHKVVRAHLKLAVKIAKTYKGYGLPMAELTAESSIGLMRALPKFDPDKGARFNTYASFWVKAAITEYILKNWSMVKTGTTANQKKLFFNLASIKRSLGIDTEMQLQGKNTTLIAEQLQVPEADVEAMNNRMYGRDLSLNTLHGSNSGSGDSDEATEWQDLLEDGSDSTEDRYEAEEQQSLYHKLITEATEKLDGRQKDIFTRRRLNDPKETLQVLADEYGLTRERIRQVEMEGFDIVEKHVRIMSRRIR